MSIEDSIVQAVRVAVRDELAALHTGPATSSWLTAAQAAEHLSLTENAVRGLVKRREIPFTKFPNGRLRFSAEDLDGWARSAR